MARATLDFVTTLGLALPIGASVLFMAGRADAATPTYYNNLGAFQADITDTVTDDYSNPGYVFVQSNAQMSAVLGETDYVSTGHIDNNIVSDGVYCAGCNGSFELSFQTTTVGTAAGVHGVGMNIVFSDPGLPYFAYILFADGTTANLQLPVAGSFWGVSAPERIERIHFGLSMGGTTQGGAFGIDNLVIGDGNLGGCMIDADCMDDDPCTNQECVGGGCQSSPVICDDEDPCTDDSCEPGVGCSAVPNTAPCDDADPCTLDDVCSEGECLGESLDCNDDDACTIDYCDRDRVECLHSEKIDCCDEDSDCPDGYHCLVDTCAPEPTGSSDAGPGDTGLDDTGGAESGVITSGAETGIAGSTGADTGSGFDQDEQPDFSVCTCTTTPAPEGRLWWLMVPLGLALRRCRRAARA
jgi:hypothetical protein